MKTISHLLVCLAVLTLLPLPVLSAEAPETVAGYPAKAAFELGTVMYREGVLPSGEPMQAIVQGDIPVDGTMFSCQSCHLRSGLGATEGTVVTPPTNGGKLYKTLRRGAEIETRPARHHLPETFQGGDERPAYNDETLENALWYGTDAAGQEMSYTMPRYDLDDRSMDILVYYLKNLSVEYSPGVDQQTIKFATIVTDEVNPDRRDNHLAILKAYINDRNSQNRHEEKRAKQGPFYRQDRFTAYRRLELKVWELQGKPESWQKQLETYYKNDPVFAFVGGITDATWAPIHDFAEENQIPSILPMTDLPKVTEEDWYTLYFSKGYYQEGQTAAKYLRDRFTEKPPPVLQIYRETTRQTALAEGFTRTWTAAGYPAPGSMRLDAARVIDAEFWQQIFHQHPGTILTIWLSPEDIAAMKPLPAGQANPRLLMFSTRMLEKNFSAIPEQFKKTSLLTYPYRHPKDLKRREQVIKKWLDIRGIPENDLEMQTNTYFLGWLLTGAVKMMGDDYYRDYFLDVIDMMPDEEYAITNYKRLSFGPGQRFASKGCYIAKIGEGSDPQLELITDWVVY